MSNITSISSAKEMMAVLLMQSSIQATAKAAMTLIDGAAAFSKEQQEPQDPSTVTPEQLELPIDIQV